MKGLLAVLKREYVQRLRSRWFLLGTFLAPVFLFAVAVGPMLYEMSETESQRNLAVVDRTDVLYERVAPRLEEAGFRVTKGEEGAVESLRQRIEAGELGGFLVLDRTSLTRGRAEFHGEESPGTLGRLGIRGAVTQSALEVRLRSWGTEEDLEALLEGGELELVLRRGSPADPGAGPAPLVRGFVGGLLLYMVILLYAGAVMQSTLEEKTSRVVEVLASSVRPAALMLGKILGVGSVGLTQLAVWVGMGVLALTLGLPALTASHPDLVDPDLIRGALPGPGLTILFLCLFLGGYFLYAALYAAVGAMCSSEEEARQAQLPLVLLLIVPIMLLQPMMEDPNSLLATVTSQFPFFSPVLLYARAATVPVPVWQLVSGLVLLFGGVLATAWVAGRIYRTGILMQGKRPTLPELWRWVKEA